MKKALFISALIVCLTAGVAFGELRGDGKSIISGGVIKSATITSPDIDGGTIDGTTIGANAAAAGSFTTLNSEDLTASGNIQSGSDGTDGQITIFSEQGGTDYSVVLQPHASMTATTTYNLPADDGDEGQVLYTDGSGNLSWVHVDYLGYYGVSWNESTDNYSRTGTLAGVAAGSSPGDNYLPIQAAMKRVVINTSGVVQYYLDPDDSYNRDGVSPSVSGTDDAGAASKLSDTGVFTAAESAYKGRYVHNTTDDTYALITAKDDDDTLSIDADIMDNGETFEVCTAVLNGDDGQVMVEIPKFYYRYAYSSNTHTWDIAWLPISTTGGEFVLHPAFVKNGQEVDYRYIGAFEGVGYDNGTSAYWQASGAAAATAWPGGTAIDTANDKLGSVAGYTPITYETRAEFRAIAGNVGTGWRIADEALWSAVQLLYLVEYADFYSQSMIGTGNTSYSAWNYGECIAKNGMSLPDGNGTNASNTAEDAIDTGGSYTNGDEVSEYMTYRGIENLYGATWEWVDGINVNDDVPYISNDDSHFADDTSTDYWRVEDTGGSGITLGGSDGYQQTLEQTRYGFLPASVGGASNTYVTDYYWQSSGWRVVARGGYAYDGARAGVFCVSAARTASDDDSNVGGRLAY